MSTGRVIADQDGIDNDDRRSSTACDGLLAKTRGSDSSPSRKGSHVAIEHQLTSPLPSTRCKRPLHQGQGHSRRLRQARAIHHASAQCFIHRLSYLQLAIIPHCPTALAVSISTGQTARTLAHGKGDCRRVQLVPETSTPDRAQAAAQVGPLHPGLCVLELFLQVSRSEQYHQCVRQWDEGGYWGVWQCVELLQRGVLYCV